MIKEYQTVTTVKGPLIVVENITDVGYNELVKIKTPAGEIKTGQVLEIGETYSIVQIFEGTSGLDTNKTSVRFLGESVKFGVSEKILGRTFSGSGKPIDNLGILKAKKRLDINGLPINPIRRSYPDEFIQTGISSIDMMNTLVRGQKLPIFSGAGMPHNKLAVQIAKQASVKNSKNDFAIVFAAMGITHEESLFFQKEISSSKNKNVVMFLNEASDPTIEQFITPRLALTTAEYLAFEKDMHVLVILTDMTNYCNALSEISAARNEIPGRRGYPGYMYTDLSSIYERAGRIQGKNGSITQIPIVTMPDDDITHPIPDLTGYITEGQFVFSRNLHNNGIYPPVDVLPSLSRLMKKGIGKGKTREDHKEVSDQLYAAYSRGREVRDLIAVVGEESIDDVDKLYLKFANDFENTFLKQSFSTNNDILTSLMKAWDLLSILPRTEIKRIQDVYIDKYMNTNKNK